MKIDLNTLLLVGGGIALYHYYTLSKDKQKEIKQKIGIEPKYTEPTPPVIDDVPVVTTPTGGPYALPLEYGVPFIPTMPSAGTTTTQAGLGVQSAPVDVQLPPATAPQSQADCGAGLVFDRRYPCGIPGCDWIEECITPEEKALRDAAPLRPSARPMGFSGFTGINNEHEPGNFLTDDPGDIQSMTDFINDVP